MDHGRDVEVVLASGSIAEVAPGRGRWIGLAALLAIACALGWVLLSVSSREVPGEIGGVAAIAAVLLTAAYAVRRGDPNAGVRREGEAGTLHATPELLEIRRGGGRRTVVRAEIEGGFLELHGLAHQVVVQLRGGGLVVAQVDDPSRAEAFLDALSLAPSRRALVLELGSIASPAARAALGASLVLLLPLCAPFVFFALVLLMSLEGSAPADALETAFWTAASAIPVALVFAILRALVRVRVRVGADGLFARFLVRRRFVPLSAIEGAFVEGDAIVLRGARPLRLRAATDVEARVVAERLAHLFGREAERAPALAALHRGGRTIRAWREALRELVDDGYRAACAPEDLARVVEDPTGSPELRVAAAVALASHASPLRDRVRVAIDAAADPMLRAALGAASGGEIDEGALAGAMALRAAVQNT